MIRHFLDAAEFAAVTAPLLEADPARGTVLLTAASGLVTAPNPTNPPTLLAILDGGVPVAAAIQLAPYPVSLVIDPAAADRGKAAAELARAVVEHANDVTWFAGPSDDCARVAAGWATSTGASLHSHMNMLLHRLGEFRPVEEASGFARAADPADPADLALLARWRRDFSIVIGDPQPPAVEPEAVWRSHRAGSTATLWCDDGGHPVSYAAHSPVIAGMARVGPVYTPAEHERHGYGSAVTSAAVRSALRQGATTVVLFTDVANPTSNAIYRRLGFEPVEEFLELAVDAG